MKGYVQVGFSFFAERVSTSTESQRSVHSISRRRSGTFHFPEILSASFTGAQKKKMLGSIPPQSAVQAAGCDQFSRLGGFDPPRGRSQEL